VRGRCCQHSVWLCFLFSVADCVCRGRSAGWFSGGAASWVVGASSFDGCSLGWVGGWYRH